MHAAAGDDAAAEAAYRQAVDLARYQGARALELRSATRLAASVAARASGTPRIDVASSFSRSSTPSTAQAALPDLDLAHSILAVGIGITVR